MSRSTILHVTPVIAVFVVFFIAIALLVASANSANAVATTPPTVGAGAGDGDDGTLARTGVTVWPLVVAGAFTLTSGAVLLYLRRRAAIPENQRTLGVRSGTAGAAGTFSLGGGHVPNRLAAGSDDGEYASGVLRHDRVGVGDPPLGE